MHIFTYYSSIFSLLSQLLGLIGKFALFGFLINVSILHHTYSQEFLLGKPEIYNHTKESYQAGSQNWNIAYSNGHVFFANNWGLLEYNGIRWQTFGTPNNTILRSICIGPNNNIYTGAQNEIGYFEPAPNGMLSYVNLIDSLPKEAQNSSDIWFIEYLDSKLYFSSDRYINQYSSNHFERFGNNGNITFMKKINDQIWYHSEGTGIHIIAKNEESYLSSSESIKDVNVIEILHISDNQYYIVTAKNGIFTLKNNQIRPWKHNAEQYVKSKIISSATYNSEQCLYIGTYLGGILNIKEDGRTSIVLTKQDGLQNNSINCLTILPNNVLWVGTNNGIEEINISPTFQKFYPDNNLQGAVYDMDKWNGNLFFSTSNGLYQINEQEYYNPLKENAYNLVSGTNGQTWGTDIINGQLYCAHHEGPKLVTDISSTISISQETGTWKYIKLDQHTIAVGGYQGVSLYSTNGDGELTFIKKLDGLSESARIMAFDNDNNLWVSHPYKKVYRISFNHDYTEHSIQTYSSNDGFQTNNRNYVFNVNGQCFLTNPTGIYMYNPKTDSFISHDKLNEYFGENNHVRRLINKEEGIWAITDETTVLLSMGANGTINTLQELEVPTNETYIGGFEQLFELNDNTAILSTEEGAIEYQLHDKVKKQKKVMLKHISLPRQQDSIVYGGFGQSKDITLAPNENAIRIDYFNEYPKAKNKAEYSIRLHGVDENWSSWTSNTTKEYNNLGSGTYTIEIRSKEGNDIIYAPKASITIDTQWHSSWLAYLIYSLIICSIPMAIFLIPRKKYKETTAQLEDEKRSAEKEVEIIKQEKLETEIQFKNRELANSTLHLLQKNQTLDTLRKKVKELNSNIKNPAIQKELKQLLSIFRDDMRIDEDWSTFSFYFDQVHHDFIQKLKLKYPDLTTKDHKLCAYLKMNLNTKEIAPLLNISVRGVEISRYRLRKKLNIERRVKLNEFFIDIAENHQQ